MISRARSESFSIGLAMVLVCCAVRQFEAPILDRWVAWAELYAPKMIRPAQPADAEAIAAIYNEGIEDRQATFQPRPHDPGELELKTEQMGGQLLVAERDGRVVGWAGWSGYNDRSEYYAGIAECAVYVARDARGQRIGAALLDGLAEEAPKFGVHKLVAKIFTSNVPSIA